jgi:hypothetical protein
MKPGLWSWRYFGNNARNRKPGHESVDVDWHQGHRVIAEDVDNLDADHIAARAFVAVFGADQFEIAILARVEVCYSFSKMSLPVRRSSIPSGSPPCGSSDPGSAQSTPALTDTRIISGRLW